MGIDHRPQLRKLIESEGDIGRVFLLFPPLEYTHTLRAVQGPCTSQYPHACDGTAEREHRPSSPSALRSYDSASN